MTKQGAIDKLPILMKMYKDDLRLLQENLELLNRLHQGLEEVIAKAIQK